MRAARAALEPTNARPKRRRFSHDICLTVFIYISASSLSNATDAAARNADFTCRLADMQPCLMGIGRRQPRRVRAGYRCHSQAFIVNMPSIRSHHECHAAENLAGE